MRTIAAGSIMAMVAVHGLGGPADARPLHRHHGVVAPAADAAPLRRAAIPQAYSYYPHEIEGGVSGNLPFNNQIRKHVDPLNANGGGG